MALRYLALPTADASALRAGAPDAYGRPAERMRAEGTGNPCRHCLDFVTEGADMLVLSWRPFPALQPYAETGPVFLCADCAPWAGQGMPPVLTRSPDFLLKGYSADHRILYGTGRVVRQGDLEGYAQGLLQRPDVAFVDVRSARNNCYQLRILRGGAAGG